MDDAQPHKFGPSALTGWTVRATGSTFWALLRSANDRVCQVTRSSQTCEQFRCRVSDVNQSTRAVAPRSGVSFLSALWFEAIYFTLDHVRFSGQPEAIFLIALKTS